MVDRTVFISGQLGFNPRSMQLVPGGIEAQMHQAMTNMDNIIRAAKGSMKVVKSITLILLLNIISSSRTSSK